MAEKNRALVVDEAGMKKFYFAYLGLGTGIDVGAGKVRKRVISIMRSRFDTQLTLGKILARDALVDLLHENDRECHQK